MGLLSKGDMKSFGALELAAYIDHTSLSAMTAGDDVIRLCNEAKQHLFASVCVNPAYVSLAARELSGSDVKVCTVIGFPLGATLTSVKAYETKIAIDAGAQEVDMVINIGALKDGDDRTVEEDIRAVVKAAEGQTIVKVIIETCVADTLLFTFYLSLFT